MYQEDVSFLVVFFCLFSLRLVHLMKMCMGGMPASNVVQIVTCNITNVELPFFTDPSAYSYAWYGQGTGPIYLSYVSCTGRESSLLDCQYYQDEIGNVRSCYHYLDAGVRCPCKDL